VIGPRLLLTKFGRRWFRRFPTSANQRFLRDRFRKWCVTDDLQTWTAEGFQMQVSPHNYNTYEIYFFGWYDFELTRWMKAHIPEGATCWDVGAAEGWFTLLMGHLVGPSGRTDAFEAFGSNYKKLQRNVALNHFTWVNLNNVAISDIVGVAQFVPPSDEVTHHSSYLEDHTGVGYLIKGTSLGTFQVPTTTLDMYAEETKVIHLEMIKMDIEGAEVAALQGALHTIERFHPKIAIEYNQEAAKRAGTSIEELDDLLDSYGYDRYTFWGQLKQLRLEEWKERPDNEVVFNVYCFPRK